MPLPDRTLILRALCLVEARAGRKQARLMPISNELSDTELAAAYKLVGKHKHELPIDLAEDLGLFPKPENPPRNERERLQRILDTCPDVRVGDTWESLWLFPGPVTVAGWKNQSEDGLPWPLVQLSKPDGTKKEVGLPAFKFATLVKRGRGTSWKTFMKEAA